MRVPLSSSSGSTWTDNSSEAEYCFESSAGTMRLRKRTAYPATFTKTKGPVLIFGYGNPPAAMYETNTLKPAGYYNSTEFLYCTIDAAQGVVEVHRDAFCTLPLFVRATPQELLLSDDMELLKSESLTIDDIALASLLLKPRVDDRTLFQEIALLPERSRLRWSSKAIELQKPPLIASRPKKSPSRDFKRQLEGALDRYWQQAENNTVAFEVSGGIDSATIPLYISKKYRPEIRLGSMRFLEGFGTTQDDKLQGLMRAVRGELTTVQISQANHYPLARFFANGFQPHLFYQYQEIYTEALDELAAKLGSEGVDTVFTGIGGDELFESLAPSASHPQDVKPLAFITQEAFHDLSKKIPAAEKPVTLLANSALYAGQSRNKIYIDHGIWPVAPLADPCLYSYTQNLSFAFRANKNILRAYHEASGFPVAVYHPVQNEHFGRFFEDALKENYTKVLDTLGNKNKLEERGIADWQKVMETFDEARWHESRSRELFALFRLVTAAIILEAADC